MKKPSELFLSILLIILITACSTLEISNEQSPMPLGIPTKTTLKTPSALPAATSWQDIIYTQSACISNVSFVFPKHWIIIDVQSQGFEKIIATLTELAPNSQWNTDDYSSATASEILKIYAIDPEPINDLFVIFHVTQEEIAAPSDASILASQAIESYRNMGLVNVSLKGEYTINGIDAAMIKSLSGVIEFVECRGLTLHPNSKKALEYLLKEEREKLGYQQ